MTELEDKLTLLMPSLSPRDRILIGLASRKSVAFEELKNLGWENGAAVDDQTLHITLVRVRKSLVGTGLTLSTEKIEGTSHRLSYRLDIKTI